ncbi:MAG: diacylglycerol kinase family protein [Dehalococcoidia bacterium]
MGSNEGPAGVNPRVPRSLKRAGSLAESFGYAFAGLRYAFGTQRNIRVQSLAGIGAIALGFVVGLSWLEWAVLLLVIAFVLVSEMINTVFETIVDMITQEHDPHAMVAKDVGAAAVITAAIVALLVGALLFVPKLLALFGH